MKPAQIQRGTVPLGSSPLTLFLPSSFRFLFIILSGMRLSPLGTVATIGLLYQPQMIADGDCGATGGMKIGRGNRSTRRKPPQSHFHKPHTT
jgi:hypothetical protein